MEEKVKFSENVILMDVAFLNEIVCNAKNFLTTRLGRELPQIDLPAWLSYLALDCGLREGNNEVQVLFVCNSVSEPLKCCEPSNLIDLDGMACRTSLGEFLFAPVAASDLVTTEELYLDLMNLALDAADVKQLMLIPYHPAYGEKVEEALRTFFKGKSQEECDRATYFVMEDPARPVPCAYDYILYSLTKAFGISPDEF